MVLNLLETDWYWFYTHVPVWNFAHYPPWTFVLLYPLAKCPLVVGWIVMILLSILVSALYVKRFWHITLFLLSPPATILLLSGNVDLLMLSTFMLSLRLGLMVVMCKPMMYCGWMLRKVCAKPLSVIPLLILCLLSTLIWPGWWTSSSSAGLAWNRTISQYIWPYGIPIGILLLLTNSELAWIASGLFLVPYVMPYHLVPLLAMLYKRLKVYQIIVLNILLWVIIYHIRN